MNGKILIVDDSKTDILIIVNMLNDFNVLTANDGIEAFMQLEKNPDIDLVILDLNMPNMNGFEFLEKMKANLKYNNIWTIILTQYDEMDNEIKGLQAGAADFIRKPLNMASLRARINIQMQLRNFQNLITRDNKSLDLKVKEKTAELEKITEQLKRSDLLFRTIFEQAPIGLAIGHGDKNIASVFNSPGINPMFEKITGRSKEELAALSWQDITHPDDIQVDLDKLKQLFAGEIDGYDMEKRYIKPDGSVVWVNMIIAPLKINDDLNFDRLCIVEDITARKKKEEQILYMQCHDDLTGLYNRNFYGEALVGFDKAQYLPLSVIVADIDGVRLVNDAFGYLEGNKCIIKTAQILQSCCRPEYVLARLGGDEFGIVMPNTDSSAANDVRTAIINACEAFNKNDKTRLYDLIISVGTATKNNQEENIIDVMKLADNFLLNRKMLSSKSLHNTLIKSILATLYEKSQETEEHAKRIAEISKAIGEKMELPPKCIDELELYSMLHDIGKVGVDDKILKKPTKLTEDEWKVMKTHSEIGFRITNSSVELASIAEYLLAHHERWDGTGYPQGLKGEKIPLLSRIVAVADSYDAMTNERVYRKAMTHREAMKQILEDSGKHYDPEVVKAFQQVLGKKTRF